MERAYKGGSASWLNGAESATLIRAIRALDSAGNSEAVREACGALVANCMPMFQFRSGGLRHRPDLQQEAIGNMIEQLLREVKDPTEQFLVANFPHYLGCLCADNFTKVLRQEGLSYRRDEQGAPVGRPKHIPHVLVDSLSHPPSADSMDDSDGPSWDIAARHDPLADRLAGIEAERILSLIPDSFDRQIVILRIFQGLTWDEIAECCGKTERTMRLHFERTMRNLREMLQAEVGSMKAKATH